MTKKIKKAEAELKNIIAMKTDLQRYIDCAWKSTLLKSCELVEVVWRKELKRLRDEERLKALNQKPKPKKTSAKVNKFGELNCSELEEIAFSIHTPDHMAQMALQQLLEIA